MLESFKRWFAREPGGPDGRGLVQWARQHDYEVKRVREGEGLVIEGDMHRHPWRLEWGAPQRSYILDRELRLRMELGLPQGLQMLVISRGLAEELEQAAYAMFTEGMQTRLDSGMPEEMRWLAMFQKTQVPALKPLRHRFSAVGSAAAPVNGWLEGELAARLVEATRDWLQADDPFVLMTLRGRLYLRVESLQPSAELLEALLKLYEVAAERALAVAAEVNAQQQGWSTTMSTAWQTAYEDLPDDLDDRQH